MVGFSSFEGRYRTYGRGIACAFALALGFALPASTASAASCTTPPFDVIEPSCFEAGDGNLVVNNVADGRIDWASETGEETNTDGTGATDSRFVSGSKELSPLTWNLESGSSPDKIDMLASGALVELINNNFYLYGAFERQPPSNQQTGDANLAFELNKIAGLFDIDNDVTTAPVPKRSEGDLLITFDGQADPRIGMCIWHGDELGQRVGHTDYGWYTLPGFGNGGGLVDSNTPCTELNVVSEPKAFGAMNVGQVLDNSAPYLTDFASSLANSTFGEIAVNVTLALSTLQNPSPCLDFGQIWLHSRTSEAVTSTMADYVSPVPIQKGKTCSLEVDKKVAVNDPAGPYHDGTPQDPSFASNGDTLYYTLAVHNDGATTVTIDDVLDPNCSTPTIAPADKRANAGVDPDLTPLTFDPDDVWTYRCSHVLAPGDPEPYVNTVTVNGHSGPLPGFPVTDTDSASTGRLATLVLRKDQVGGSDTEPFAFTVSQDLGAGFSLSESDGDHTFSALVPNNGGGATYEITETADPQQPYDLTAVVCRTGPTVLDPLDGDSTTSVPNRKATVVLSPGQTVYCTFTNTRQTGSLEVVKDLAPANDPGLFDLLVGGVAQAQSVGDGGTTGVLPLVTGQYSVAEAVAGGGVTAADYVSSIRCTPRNAPQTVVASGNGLGPVQVTLGKGDDVLCTVTNERRAKLIVRKDQVDGSNAQEFTFSASTNLDADGTFDLSESDGNLEFPGLAPNVANQTSYTVTEASPQHGYVLDNLSCDDNDSVETLATGTAAVKVSPGETVTCTWHNQAQATIEVVKDLIPASDPGVFDLQVDGTTEEQGAGDGDTTGAVPVNAGQHTVGELAGNQNVSLGDYVSSINCVGGTNAAGAGAGPLNVTVAPGDTIVCTVRNERKATIIVRKLTQPAEQPATTAFGFASTLSGAGIAQDGSFSLLDGGQVSTQLPAGAYAVTENDASLLNYKLMSIVCEETNQNSTTNLGQRLASIQADPGETVTCTFVNRLVTSQLVVVKSGDLTAYHGDQVTYSFAVSTGGTSALHSVSVSDDHCSPVSAAPTTLLNDDGDGLLEPIGVDAINPEVWVYTCTTTIAAHAPGEADPIVNTATVNALDELDRPVSDTDTHATDIRHVGVDISKAGPATATAGDRVTYTLTVSNTGDTAIAQPLLVVTDALCEAPPARTSVNGDVTPTVFDPGDVWTFTCTVQTLVGQTSVPNVAHATGTDVNGRSAADTATLTTTLAQPPVPPVETPPVVQGEIVVSGTSQLRGPEGCPRGRTTAVTVTGKRIRSVTFSLDGRRLRVVTKPDSRGRWRVTIRLSSIGYGTHRVTALVRHTANTRPTTRTLRMVFSRCRPQITQPKFTG